MRFLEESKLEVDNIFVMRCNNFIQESDVFEFQIVKLAIEVTKQAMKSANVKPTEVSFSSHL